MILRILASVAIVTLLALDLLVPNTAIGRRGRDATLRADVDGAVLAVGDPLPALLFEDLEGRLVRSDDLRGKRVLLTFERSVDW